MFLVDFADEECKPLAIHNQFYRVSALAAKRLTAKTAMDGVAERSCILLTTAFKFANRTVSDWHLSECFAPALTCLGAHAKPDAHIQLAGGIHLKQSS